ncbi:MAG: fibronectin type III domain-containing protein, partial [Bacteroidia bacterium]|nr:fibronectin type III domain-containing protein [Bacteroidia bacterium]
MKRNDEIKITTVYRKWKYILLFILSLVCYLPVHSQSSYPVHATVQVLPPYGIYLNDYVSGSRDRLIVTLLNRDMNRPVLEVRLQMQIRNSNGFQIQSRNEIPFPVLSLESGIPLRLTSGDLQPYFAPENTTVQGNLHEGRLPSGMTEFSFRVVEAHTGLPLSGFSTGRVWVEIKKPPLQNLPLQGEQTAWREPQHIRFQWQPQHQGLANTLYEFVLKELPDNGVAPQSAFAYGQEIFRTEIRQTTLNYTHLEPLLTPGRRYGWQVRAISKDGIDEVGMFENHGYSEIRWFEPNENCPPPAAVIAQSSYRKISLRWQALPAHSTYTVEYRPKSARELYAWTSIPTPQSEISLTGLRPGWTYEYRVGSFCTTGKAVYSPVAEITLSPDNESLAANCGMAPTVDLSNQNPIDNLNIGDVVTIGGDFPMTLTQVSPQGNGWFSGKGWITMPWLSANVLVKFNRLRVNSDYKQMDGEVETETDPNASQIADLNKLDYGGDKTTPGKIIFTETKVDFVIPPVAEAEYNPEKEELLVYDVNGQAHAVQIPQKGEGKSVFPVIVTDKAGNKYKVELPDEEDTAQNDADNTP